MCNLWLAKQTLYIYFAHADCFAFASEKKALEAMGFPHAIVLDPRLLLNYNITEDL